MRGAKGSEKEWTCDKDADAAITRNDIAAGISLHKKFLERFPENALALYHLGYAYGQTGDHLKEVFYYERAIALGFKKDQIYFNLGMAYGELNKKKQSVNAFKQAIKINPEKFKGNRDFLIQELETKGIETRPGFHSFSSMPLYNAPHSPVADEINKFIISLPSFSSIKDEEIDFICEQLKGLTK